MYLPWSHLIEGFCGLSRKGLDWRGGTLHRRKVETSGRTRRSKNKQSKQPAKVPKSHPSPNLACLSPLAPLPALIGSQSWRQTRSLSPIGPARTWGGVRKPGPGDSRDPLSRRAGGGARGGTGGGFPEERAAMEAARRQRRLLGSARPALNERGWEWTGGARARGRDRQRAWARLVCARAARGSSEPPPGGRGGGGAGECVRFARAWEGLSSPNPHPDPSPGLWGSVWPSPWALRLFAHFLPSHLPFRPSTRPPPTPDRCFWGTVSGSGWPLGWRNCDWERDPGVQHSPCSAHAWETGLRGTGPESTQPPKPPSSGKFPWPWPYSPPSTGLVPLQADFSTI